MKKQWKSIIKCISVNSPAVGISLGLLEDDDIELKTWNAMIYGFGLDNRQFQNNDWQLHLECSEDYPNVPPKIKFIDRIPLDIVDKNNFVFRILYYLIGY